MSLSTFFHHNVCVRSPEMLAYITQRRTIRRDDEPSTEPALLPPVSAPVPEPRLEIKPELLMEMMKVDRIRENTYRCADEKGTRMPAAIWVPEGRRDVVCVRVDVPGVIEGNLTVEADSVKNLIKFTGFEDPETMHGIHGNVGSPRICRTYQGVIGLDAKHFHAVDHRYTHDNGVLWFVITRKSDDSNQLRSSRLATGNFKFLTGRIMIDHSMSPKLFSFVDPKVGNYIGVLLEMGTMNDQEPASRESAFNPLVSDGKDRYYHHGFKEDGFVLSIDMPGLKEGDLKLFVEQEKISFYGREEKPAFATSENEPNREYEGFFVVNLNEFDAGNFESEIKHGVLWITVPRTVKAPPEDSVVLFHGKIRVGLQG